MLKQYIAFFLVFIISFSSFASNNKDTIPEENEPKEIIYGPTVGLGVGMLKFYGDILDANYGNPLISNIGYDLHVKQRINPFLMGRFYVMFGTVSANERSINRNLNFKSNITVGGFALEYNFDHLLPKKRVINPYVSIGIESIEFLSKTDLYDQYGNKYNYWSDGSIRNLAEDDINAANSIVIQRDYVYETDPVTGVQKKVIIKNSVPNSKGEVFVDDGYVSQYSYKQSEGGTILRRKKKIR